MRKTKFFITDIMILISIYFLYAYFLSPAFDIGNGPSIFNIVMAMFTSDPFASVINESSGVKIEYYSSKQFYFLLEAVAVLFLFVNLVVKHRRVYNNQPIQKNNGFALFLITLGLFSNMMILGTKFNTITYEISMNGSEMEFINPTKGIISFLELPSTYVVYAHLGVFAFLFFLHLVLFVLCGKYGDISPVVIRKKKDKKKTKEVKNEVSKEDNQPKIREPKMIFYDGPVPKSDNEIFIGLRDGDDIEVEPLSDIRKNVAQVKKETPKEAPKAVEKAQPAPITQTAKPVEKVQPASIKQAPKPVEKVKEEPKKVDPKVKEQISFTSNYQKRAEEVPFENEEINVFTKKNENEFLTSFTKSDVKFDFKNMCLDSHDEYYGNDDEDDEALEVEVPEI